MIEFDGEISGIAKKFRFKREWQLGIKILFIALTILLPFVTFLFYKLWELYKVEMWETLPLYCSMYVIIPLATLVINDKKTNKDLNTQKIFTDDEYIVSVLVNGSKVYKLISDTKCVNDYDEFYELVFPLSAGISHAFICQKSLLTKGTLEEFEALFEGKIVRKST